MKSVAILIPSYKRPEVLKLTLQNLFSNTILDASLNYKVGVYIALNSYTQEEVEIVTSFTESAQQCNVSYGWITYPDNRGKAAALNDLFSRFSGGYDYIVTMDNDMVIKMPWMHLIDIAEKTDFQLMGFGSSIFWAHQPSRELCNGYPLEGCTVYSMDQIAGGMMLFPRETLEKYKWTNKGGVYGFDDAQMCLDVSKKFVLNWPCDWLDHDPMSSSSPDLKRYHDRKQHFFSKGQYILQKGWDE